MMEPLTYITSGLLLTFVSGAVGKYIGGNNKMSEDHCEEKREACQMLITERIDNLAGKVEDLTKAVKSKFQVIS